MYTVNSKATTKKEKYIFNKLLLNKCNIKKSVNSKEDREKSATQKKTEKENKGAE